MQRNGCEINILIKGRKATEYLSPIDFQNYIEGREGSNFEIEVVNNNANDIEAILSVDGLSITDGKPAGEASSGYVVPARGRTTIAGWTLDSKTVAQFFFAGAKGGSYAEQSPDGDAKNKGIIGAKIFARKATYNPHVFRTFHAAGSTTLSKGVARGGTFGMNGGFTNDSWSSNAAGQNAMLGSLTSSCAGMNNVADVASAAPFSVDSMSDEPQAEIEQTLGTGFGEKTNFATQTVDFQRGDMIVLFELFYDDAQGLKRRGIDTRRPLARPSAFPADEPKGCTPPEGWRG